MEGILTTLRIIGTEGISTVTDFLWKLRWYLVAVGIVVGIYYAVAAIMPYLVLYFAVKALLGFLF